MIWRTISKICACCSQHLVSSQLYCNLTGETHILNIQMQAFKDSVFIWKEEKGIILVQNFKFCIKPQAVFTLKFSKHTGCVWDIGNRCLKLWVGLMWTNCQECGTHTPTQFRSYSQANAHNETKTGTLHATNKTDISENVSLCGGIRFCCNFWIQMWNLELEHSQLPSWLWPFAVLSLECLI